jgi:subtilisin family serine protease
MRVRGRNWWEDPNWSDNQDPSLNMLLYATTPGSRGTARAAGITQQTVVQPKATPGINAVQLDTYNYGATTVYGSNFTAAWRYATGTGVTVALIDDGFDPSVTKLFGNFSAASRNFGTGSGTMLGEPAGGFHGTTTSGLIGDSGAGGLPVGLAPNAIIEGVRVTFGNSPFSSFVQALQYAGTTASVINNSWAFDGYGVGEPTNASFATWYTALQSAVQHGRNGLGAVVTFAAGNDRADANNVGLQPINSDPRVIAVAASDANGTVASYSDPGAGLLVAAIGDNVAVPLPGAQSYAYASGTSYAAPTVAAVTALMLSVNPSLGWRDVQEILAASAYAPAPSAAGFATNGATDWNGGGMHFSNDLGFGVIDANVAVNLARAWTEQSTSANLVTSVARQSKATSVAPGATVVSSLAFSGNLRIQHVQVQIADTNILAANTKLVLISPDGTQSVLLNRTGEVAGVDETGGLDLSGSVITSNAFWGENAAGTWKLQVQDIGGNVVGMLQNWSLDVWGDNAAIVPTPLVYTPEFAALAASNAARTVVTNHGTNATTIDLIALPGTTSINLNGGTGKIDGVAVTVAAGLRNANADGSTGSVTLTGISAGGSILTGGDGTTTIIGAGRDLIVAGLGATSINTGTGGSSVTLNGAVTAAIVDTVSSGGGDTIWAGSGTVSIQDTGVRGDAVYAQAAHLSFIGGSGASTVYAGSGTVLIQGGVGGGTFYAGSGGNSVLTGGSGKVTFYGAANGDVLTAAGSAGDTLVAGAGNETLSGGTSIGANVLQGGSGNDTMIAGAGRTTFIVGTANDTITIGGIADLVTLQYGHAGGLDTVAGFRLGIDDLHLIGYAANAASVAINGATADGHGGSLLHFADNTRIDLLGIAHVTQSMFA